MTGDTISSACKDSPLFATDAQGESLRAIPRNIWGAYRTPINGQSPQDDTDCPFTSYTYDPVLGQYFARARFYDPANYTDPTGEVANILAGGIVGGTIGFAWGFAGSAISQRMSGRRVDWRRAAGAGINGAVIGAVRGAMTASGVGAAAAFAGNFAAGTAGSALEQWIGTGNVSARRSVAGGLINAVNNAVYKDYVFKSGTQALKKGFLAGGARAGIEYLSETLGKPSKYDRNRRSARRSYMPESRDPRISCGREDPLGKSLGYSSARGYQYKNPQTNRGFRLGEFIGTVLRGGLVEGLNNLMFFEAGKAVEALGVSVSPHEGDRRSVDDLISDLHETTSGKGVAKNFQSSGGFDQTLKDFDSLNLTNIKDIQTQYGPGKVGKLDNGAAVVARPGSKTGGATLEIRISNNKVYKIRY